MKQLRRYFVLSEILSLEWENVRTEEKVELSEDTQNWGKVANFDASTFFLETSDSFDYVPLIIGIVSGVFGAVCYFVFFCLFIICWIKKNKGKSSSIEQNVEMKFFLILF